VDVPEGWPRRIVVHCDGDLFFAAIFAKPWPFRLGKELRQAHDTGGIRGGLLPLALAVDVPRRTGIRFSAA